MAVFGPFVTRLRFLLCLLLCWPLLAAAGVRVEVKGVDGALRDNAEAYLSIRDAADRKDLDQATVDRLHRQAGPQLREALRPFGYYNRSEEHTSELQSLMRISYAVFCLKKKNNHKINHTIKI